jgi:hypothetical protein
MKRIFILVTFLFHSACNAEYVITVPSQQSWSTILSDSNIQIYLPSDNATHTVDVQITFSTQHKPFCHHTSAPQYNR